MLRSPLVTCCTGWTSSGRRDANSHDSPSTTPTSIPGLDGVQLGLATLRLTLKARMMRDGSGKNHLQQVVFLFRPTSMDLGDSPDDGK